MDPIVTPDEMAQVDASAPEPTETLIARAGAAVALAARRLMGGTYGRRVLIAAGKGNNGADGRVAAEVLRHWGVRCEVADPATALEKVAQANERLASGSSNRSPCGLVIDAAYGTGLRGSWGAAAPPPAPVLAVDVPSGIDALTGENYGCWPAVATVTFGALKPGLLLHPGASAAGEVIVAPIGLGDACAHTAAAWRVTDADAAELLLRPAPADHKWKRAVRVIAGSPQMRGAGELVCAAAQAAGAGMVVVSSPGVEAAEVARPTEAVARDLPATEWARPALEGIEKFHAAVIGPGLGTDPATLGQVQEFIARCPIPVVADADALTAVAADDTCLVPKPAARVLTPHDGEFARLTGGRPRADRFEAVREAARRLGAVVLLKGSTTLVAAPHEPDAPRHHGVLAVTSGTQRLATAGSGDVLSGVIAAVLAAAGPTQPVANLVAAAAHWHGRTASVASGNQPLPLLASRQVSRLPEARP